MYVATSVDELLAGATDRRRLDGPGKSGALLERVTLDGQQYVVKYLDHDADWTLRVANIPGSASVELWRRGVLAELPDCINQPIVAVAHEAQRPAVAALLMHDVGRWLVPATDDLVPPDQHERFLDHMAALHAAFWERRIDVVSPTDRYLELSPRMAAAEAALGSDHLVPRLVAQGWPLLAEVAPALAGVVVPLVREPGPLVDALDTTPATFVHGNWKLDNLGSDDRDRTVLLDWELPGVGAAASDLAWYLAINCRRLPTTKEQTIASYRAALERHGVATEPWWHLQLGLCLVGAMVQFGWEKALGGYDDELAWWEEQVLRAAPLLGTPA
ncbi:aminoglycoside phosphotransferase [Nocardioides immobilis]|uniref:Aminoglycoside phosphotransferase n=1 Tax=Nocardioides immobilis TaxID=2049295 RepID=A0A417Y877_9ACTN|nr:phosphotransferase [Nocardioides immobilis]RHW28903.1 aminoglycoside phosphotransferase [Nocardioides immobilis]